jgi:hypothetical protein
LEPASTARFSTGEQAQSTRANTTAPAAAVVRRSTKTWRSTRFMTSALNMSARLCFGVLAQEGGELIVQAH